MYSLRYQNLFADYQYDLKQVIDRPTPNSHLEFQTYKRIALNETFDDFDIHYFRSNMRIVLWNRHSVLQLDRNGKVFYKEELESDTLGVRQTSIVFTLKNKVGFLGIDGKASAVFCRAEPDSQLVAAHVDALSSGHVYGLSKDGFVYVFKTSNLL